MLQRFAIIFVLLLFVPDTYIYWGYIKKWINDNKSKLNAKSSILNLLWWLPSIILVIGFIGARYIGTDNPMYDHRSIIAWLGILILWFGIPKLMFMLASLIGKLLHLIIKPIPVKPFNWAGIVLAVCFFGIAFYGAIFGIANIQVTAVDYTSQRLPQGFNGYRIVQISDIHSGSFKNRPEIIEKLVEIVNQQHPDLIVFTGDLVNQRADEIDQFTEVLSQMKATDGVYSILGNHDYGNYFRWAKPGDENLNMLHLEQQQANMGWKLLKNQHDILYHQGDSIAIIGVENDGNPPFPQLADLPEASKGTEGMFRILLSHDPTHWDREVLPDTDIDLMLAGHTHGAQFKLFGWSPSTWVYDEWGGLYQEGNQSLYVNIGIGYVGLPFRFGAWPEVTVFQLKVK